MAWHVEVAVGTVAWHVEVAVGAGEAVRVEVGAHAEVALHAGEEVRVEPVNGRAEVVGHAKEAGRA